MSRKLTITLSDEVYRGLHERIGTGKIGRFVESVVRPLVVNEPRRRKPVSHSELEAAYRDAALDQTAEAEASEWLEVAVGEGIDSDGADASR